MAGLLDLPLDVLLLVLQQLPSLAIKNVRLVNKRLCQVGSSEQVWTVRLLHDYDLQKDNFPTPTEPAVRLYKSVATSHPRVVNDLISITSCSAANYSQYYSVERCLFPASGRIEGCFCSKAVTQNITVVAKVKCHVRFTKVTFHPPGGGYSAPLTDALLFICKEEPKVEDYVQFDNWTADQLEKYTPKNENFKIAAAGWNLARAKYTDFPTSSSGCWILVKLLRSGGDKVNIDAGNIFMHGIPLDGSVLDVPNTNRKPSPSYDYPSYRDSDSE